MRTSPPDNIDRRQLIDLIQKDPALTGGLLRLANSPFFGVSRKITGIPQAITLMGLHETVEFLTFAVVRDRMPKGPTLRHFSIDQLWGHSWACASVARMLGTPQNLVHSLPGELHLTGLLHDIGKVVLAIQLPQQFQECLDLAHEAGLPLHQAERQMLGFDHAQLGGELLDDWNLPGPILEAVCYHHNPGEASEGAVELALLIQFADALVNVCGINGGGSQADADLSRTEIKRTHREPLCDESIQIQMVREISTNLGKRADAAHGALAQTHAPEKTSGPDAPAGHQGEIERGANPSVWNRLLAIFRSCFSDR